MAKKADISKKKSAGSGPEGKQSKGGSARKSPKTGARAGKRSAGTRSVGKPAKKGAARKQFVPNIVVFACNWCSYAGADSAGVNRVQYSPNFRVIRTMCSGRVTPAFVLKAFKLGADGVLVSGCHFGDCHYIFGNYRAVEQFEKTKAIVRTLGLDERRVRLEWVSAAEGGRWGEVIDDFVGQITNLGPSPLNHSGTKKRGDGNGSGRKGM